MDCQISAWENQINEINKQIAVNNAEQNANRNEFVEMEKSYKRTHYQISVNEKAVKEKATTVEKIGLEIMVKSFSNIFN